jgi:membrane-associated phospholipid phosphatase
MLIVLTAVTVEVLGHGDLSDYGALQRDWFITINHALASAPGQIWSNLTLLGDGAVLLALLSPLILWRPQAWGAMLGAAPFAGALSATAKHWFAMPRPAAVLDPQQINVIGDALTAHNSLPSGHALTIFTGLIALLAVLLPRPAGWRQWSVVAGGLLLAGVLCLSRIAVGAHWPLDLVVGAALGWVAGLLGAALSRRYAGWPQVRRGITGRCLSVVILGLSIALLIRAADTPPGPPALWLAGITAAAVAFCLLVGWPRQPAQPSVISEPARPG